jgi:CheY-like chemotaxis protein
MSGVEATRLLKAQADPAAPVPVLAVTANPSGAARELALAAGMDAYLVKPLMPALLRAELLRLLQPQAVPQDSTLPLLDGRRIAELRELGLLQELSSACLDEIGQRCERVQACTAAGDTPGAQQALHSLLGITGEAGALALHELTQGFYGTLLQGRWPAVADWCAQLETLAQRTQDAIREQAEAGWPAASAVQQTARL